MNPKTKTSSILFVIIALIIGIIIGLMIGWEVWPVTWTGGTLDILSSAAQQDYLKAAIESYAYNPDAAIAQQRYTTLGDQKEKVLSDLLANPGNLEKTDVEAFANAIKAAPAPITATEFCCHLGTGYAAIEIDDTLIAQCYIKPPRLDEYLPAGGYVNCGCFDHCNGLFIKAP